MNALSNGGVYDAVTFLDSGECYDRYTATYIYENVLYNSVLYVYLYSPFVAEVSQEALLADLSTIVNADFYITDTSALC